MSLPASLRRRSKKPRRGRRSPGRAAWPGTAGYAAGHFGAHLPAARLRYRGVPDRGRTAARLVPDRRWRAGHDCRHVRPSSGSGTKRSCRRSRRRRPGCCATTIRPTSCGWRSATTSPHRSSRFPRRSGRTRRLRCRLAAAGRARRCPRTLEMALLGRYVRSRLDEDPEFDPAGFTALCDAGGATGDKNSRHLRPAQPPRW